MKNNLLLGNSLSNVRKRINYKFVTEPKKFTKIMAKPNVRSWSILNENVVGVECAKTQVVLDKPIATGFSVLELSKLQMFDFHYNHMKKQFGNRLKLLYMDTDGLFYHIICDYLNKELHNIQHLFDFSNLPNDHPLYNKTNKKVPGRFKSEKGADEV